MKIGDFFLLSNQKHYIDYIHNEDCIIIKYYSKSKRCWNYYIASEFYVFSMLN